MAGSASECGPSRWSAEASRPGRRGRTAARPPPACREVAVHSRLAGLAQPAVADGNAEALEQALERRGPAVHPRRLDDLRRESPWRVRGATANHEAPPAAGGRGAEGVPSRCPASRRISVAGEEVIHRDLQRAGQAVLARNARGVVGPQCALHADLPVPRFRCEPAHRGGEGAVLRPGKALEAQPGRLPGADAAQRVRGLEVRDDSQLPGGGTSTASLSPRRTSWSRAAAAPPRPPARSTGRAPRTAPGHG